MTEARAHLLAKAADILLCLGPAGLDSNGHMWRLGSLGFWKSSSLAMNPCPVPAFDTESPLPRYRRGGLLFSLFPDMRLEPEPFRLKDGRQAIAIVLRSDNDPEGIFGTFALDEKEAHRIITFVTNEMNAARQLAAERFKSAGGDLTALDSMRAPSRAELTTQLDSLFGNPDEQ